LDYLAVNRTCALDTMVRSFNLMPSRFHQSIAYLGSQDWRKGLTALPLPARKIV